MGGSLTGSTVNSVVIANRYAHQDGHVHLATQNVVRFTVTGAGNVGIGTSSPASTLAIQGSGSADDLLRLVSPAGGGNYAGIRFEGGASGGWGLAAIRAMDTGGFSGDLAFLTDGDGINNVNLTEKMRITKIGNVGIGTTSPTELLTVNGTIKAEEIVVEAGIAANEITIRPQGWADDVFAPGYALPTVDEVVAHIAAVGHLPGVPSAATVADQGVALGEMQSTLLRKVEELTLYVIQLEKKNALLQARVEKLEHIGEMQTP